MKKNDILVIMWLYISSDLRKEAEQWKSKLYISDILNKPTVLFTHRYFVKVFIKGII